MGYIEKHFPDHSKVFVIALKELKLEDLRIRRKTHARAKMRMISTGYDRSENRYG
jgi:hypothetical protein